MKSELIKHWFLLTLVCIAVSSTLLFLCLQNPAVNNYHPPDQTLWQAYFWDFGWFGLEDWRLEGVNTETAIYFGKFEFYDIPLSAPAIASIAFAGISTMGLLCFAGLGFTRHRKNMSNCPFFQLDS